MGERMRAFDWDTHPLGPPRQWPESLQLAVSLCLNSSFPTAIYWGPDLHVLYNDAWSEIPAEKHPWILGKPAREAWSDIWSIIGPQFRQVLETGEGLSLYEQMLPMVRAGRARETWWNYSFTPIRNADHGIGGIFNQGNEVTAVVNARRERQAEVERWRDLFRQGPAGAALLRGREHVFEFANDGYLQLVGHRDIVGKTVREALPEVVQQGYMEVLDTVYSTGEAYIASSRSVKLQRSPGQPVEDRILDFTFQPVREAGGTVEGIFILVTDVTERARAEAALRITNWQLGEERARLATVVEAEQRAQQALRRFNDTLEAHVKQRTTELTRALALQRDVADRLRATFDTPLMFQGFLEVDGTMRDSNPVSLAAIHCALEQVVGLPFWETPWFADTPGAPERIRQAVGIAARGQVVQVPLTLHLPEGARSFDIWLRPAFNAQGEVIGIVPEAVDTARQSGEVQRLVLADVRAPAEAPASAAAPQSRTAEGP